MRSELFGDLVNQGIDLTELLNRIVHNVNDIHNYQSSTLLHSQVF